MTSDLRVDTRDFLLLRNVADAAFLFSVKTFGLGSSASLNQLCLA